MMEFSDPFEAVCANTGKKLNSVDDYENAYFDWYVDRRKSKETKTQAD